MDLMWERKKGGKNNPHVFSRACFWFMRRGKWGGFCLDEGEGVNLDLKGLQRGDVPIPAYCLIGLSLSLFLT